MTVKLSPMLIARHEIERSRNLVLENQIRRENIRCELIETRQAREARQKRKVRQ